MRELKFVGDKVIDRLEQLGFSRLSQLRSEDPSAITLHISKLIGSNCWHNSPQARSAVRGIIELASNQAKVAS